MTSRPQQSPTTSKTPALTLDAPPPLRAKRTYNRIVAAVFLVGLMLACGQTLIAQTNGAQPQPTQSEIQSIKRSILLLGDPDPATRKQAKADLEQFGNAATGELKKAAQFETTRDYETQLAATQILEKLQDALALKATESFARGESTLPGWQEFKKLTADTLESRALFRDIYLRNRVQLIKATRQPNSDTSYSQLKQLFGSPNLADVCFGMFLLARQQTQLNSGPTTASPQTVHPGPSLQQLKFLFGTISTEKSPLSKLDGNALTPVRLARKIMESGPQRPQLLSYKISLMRKFKSTEICPLLLKLAAPENPTVIRVLAIEHIIKIDDNETLAKLEPYLNDTTEVGKFLVIAPTENQTKKTQTNQQISQVQIRDLALLANLRLTEQDHAQFGFSAAAINTANNKINIKKTGFINNHDREKAFTRFQRTNSDNLNTPLR